MWNTAVEAAADIAADTAGTGADAGAVRVLDEVAPGDACPEWCINDQGGPGERHAHVSADVLGGAPEQPLIARLIGRAPDGDVRVLLNDRVATIEELDCFVGGVRKLLDQARLAEPGLGFVASLAARADLTLEDLAEAAGVSVAKVAAQDEGYQVLTVREYDQLALAVAKLVAAAKPVA